MSSNIVPGPQIADERERERVRLAQPLAISDDIIAVGRTFKGSKQRCEWHVCFGPYGREHVVEVTISKRSGKRSVSFDGQAIHTTYISPKGAFNFGFSLEGRVLSLTSRAGSTDAAAVELSVDWVRWQLLTRKDELTMAAMTELEMALQRRISDEKRAAQPPAKAPAAASAAGEPSGGARDRNRRTTNSLPPAPLFDARKSGTGADAQAELLRRVPSASRDTAVKLLEMHGGDVDAAVDDYESMHDLFGGAPPAAAPAPAPPAPAASFRRAAALAACAAASGVGP